MKKFFYPSSIAIFGVSSTGNNLARIIVENLDRFGFDGKAFPVGTTQGKLGKRKIVTSVNEIKEVPDLAVLLVPGRFVPETLMACGKKGIRHVIIESGGFTEFDESKKELENQIRSIAEQYEIQIIGPNCFGVINLENGVVLPFFVLNPGYMKKDLLPLSPRVAEFFTIRPCSHHAGVGLNKLISIGNKLLTNEIPVSNTLSTIKILPLLDCILKILPVEEGFWRSLANHQTSCVPQGKSYPCPLRRLPGFIQPALASDDEVADAALKQAGIHRCKFS